MHFYIIDDKLEFVKNELDQANPTDVSKPRVYSDEVYRSTAKKEDNVEVVSYCDDSSSLVSNID